MKIMVRQIIHLRDTGLLMVSRFAYGFTLLETLLAIIIFTFINTTVYQAVMIVTKSGATIKSKIYKTSELVKMIDAIEQDIAHIMLYYQTSKNHEYKNKFSFAVNDDGNLITEIYLLFCSKANLDFIYNYNFETVGYRLKNEKLERVIYIKSEKENHKEWKVSRFLDGVTGFSMRVYNDGGWINEWSDDYFLPQAIEVTIKVKNIGLIRRVILLLNYRKRHETAWNRFIFCSNHSCFDEFRDLRIV